MLGVGSGEGDGVAVVGATDGIAEVLEADGVVDWLGFAELLAGGLVVVAVPVGLGDFSPWHFV